MATQIVFSCQVDFQNISLQEILNVNAEIKFIKWIDDGVGLIEYNGTFIEFSKLIKENSLIFVRHINPVEYIIPLIESKKQIGDLIFTEKFTSCMVKSKNFSVQIRIANDNEFYESSEIKNEILNYFKSEGFIENKRHPEQILSVFISNDLVYIGLSNAEDNLSIWSGGMRHYATREDTISRAEFKLMEALEAYPIIIGKNSIALDLGAAPGGWTKVLLENGFKVVAVDSVQLSPVLRANENVEYFNGRIRDYIKTIKNTNKMFDLIVNDMSMNIMSSVNFIVSLKNRLREKGYIIMSLKLTRHDRLEKINEGIKILSSKFNVVFVKQLFHNRSEVTVILQKS